MRLLCVSSVLALTILSCRCGRRDPSKPATSKQEAGSAVVDVHALHGDFIVALWRRDWSGPDGFEKCVLEPETTVHDYRASWKQLHAKLPGLERGTYDSFWSENERVRPVAPLDRGAMKLQVMTKEEDARLNAILEDMQEDYWEVFRKRYGNAVRVGLSAPGFNGDRKQAMIYYQAGFAWLGSWGSYCVLKREGDRWEIADEYCAWVS